MRFSRRLGLALLLLVLALGQLAAMPPGTRREDYRRPASIPYPPENPWSAARAALGRALFFDPRLSGSNSMACASCHNPALGWEDGLPTGRGDTGNRLARATPSILDAAWADVLMWDGRFDDLEAQALGPITAPAEMNQPLPELVAELSAIPGYRPLFAAAFGDATVTVPRIAQALATYERGIRSGPAPFDRWLAGNPRAMSASAQRGFTLFTGKARCARCHEGWRFTNDSFHDTGMPSPDIGRGAQVPGLRHAFKTPGLRNIARRAPYMHNGALPTLRAVLEHYNTGFVERPSLSPEMRRLGLSPAELDDLLAFMQALTGEDAPVVLPVLPVAE